MSVRSFYIDRALTSYTGLRGVLNELTEEEVLACLELEAGSLRRRSILDRLISRAGRLHELNYTSQLKEKFQWHANPPKS
jgi:hypothetical protein